MGGPCVEREIQPKRLRIPEEFIEDIDGGLIMKQNLHIITIGVRDFKRSYNFYTKILGWESKSTIEDEIAFFQTSGVVFAIYPLEKLAEDALTVSEDSGVANFTLAHNVQSEQEVDEIIRDLEAKGVEIIKQPQKVFWGGYSSYFVDPDGFHWEVAYNPFFPFDEGGNLELG